VKKKIGIIGASGYTGFELVKILAGHSGVELLVLNSKGSGGKKISEIYPEFQKDLVYTDHSMQKIREMELDLVFLAREAGFAKKAVVDLNCKIVDLSRDLRFENNTVYGLPELFRDKIKAAETIANPGCYATAAILASYPLVKEGVVDHIIFDCKSGYSGAGRTPSYLNDPNNYEDNIIAYKIAYHRHIPEIEKCLAIFSQNRLKISLSPHVIPLFRGIMCTTHVILNQDINIDAIKMLYEKTYNDEPFVKIFEDRLPELHDIQNTNYCYLGGFEIDKNGRAVIVATLDNLVKGASGQAVQNMNLMLGFEETEALL